MIDYQRLLNPAQLEAVTTLDGPVLVVAGAGSGKTRTLVFRLARLVESGVSPERVLLLTFTRKAAEEMLARAGQLMDERCRRVLGGTFHSFCHLWLRRLAPRLGFTRQFHVLDRSDSEAIIRALKEERGLKSRLLPKNRTLAELFSRSVNRQQDLITLMAADVPHLLGRAEEIVQLRQAYTEYKRQAGLMDFDDLLVKLIELLDQDQEARAEVAGRYGHLMIDEYQDTNPLQARLVRLLSHGHDNVMAVGDDSQSIYAFRGADFRNMLRFPEDFPGARVIKLELNYRSSQPILDVANAVIAGAGQTFTKCLKATRDGQISPEFHEPDDEAAQSRLLVEKIKGLLGQGYAPEEVAVLFRASYHSFDLELALNQAGLSYAKYGGFKFAEAAHVKDVLAFLRARINPKDSLSLTRMLTLLPGIGTKTSRDIAAWLAESGRPLSQVQDFPGRGKASGQALAELAKLMAQLEEVEPSGPSAELSQVVEFYRPTLIERHDDYPRRLKELEQVADLALNYRSTYRFLSDLALEPPTTLYSPGQEGGRLVLSTVHSAKGLEWRAVFILWAVEGRFPAGPSLEDEDALEEERRLMYVAVTRAKERLYILSPQRSHSQRQGTLFHTPSRLLDRARDHLSLARPPRPVRPAPAARPEEPLGLAPAGGYSVGSLVLHPAFGRGRVAGYLGSKRIVILFEGHGHKTLHLDYAPLKAVGA